MRTSDFDPKNGLLHLSFSNGTEFSIDLKKNYHREESFYVDLFWEENQDSTSLSLALHPKAGDLVLRSCALEWPLAPSFPEEVLVRGFSSPIKTQWSNLREGTPALSFLKRQASKYINAYDPLPHPSLKKASYQAISLRNNQFSLEAKSTDESAALTIFSISNDGSKLFAENQSSGYRLRHSFPAFELQFDSNKKSKSTPKYSAKTTIAVSPEWINQPSFQSLAKSSLVEEGHIESFLLKEHENPSPGNANFDANQFSAFAKTCIEAEISAAIELSPFVVSTSSSNTGIKTDNDSCFKRWSPSLGSFIHPVDLSDEDTLRSCEQHLLRFYQLGYRTFVLQDISLSLRDGLKSTTTGQQLAQRLNLVRRVLPDAIVLIADLCASEAYSRFHGFKTEAPLSSQLPRLASFTGIGRPNADQDLLGVFTLPINRYAPPFQADPETKHTSVIDISKLKLDDKTWVSLEATIENNSYATFRARLD